LGAGGEITVSMGFTTHVRPSWWCGCTAGGRPSTPRHIQYMIS
jgi:hypothetical protein